MDTILYRTVSGGRNPPMVKPSTLQKVRWEGETLFGRAIEATVMEAAGP